MPEIIYIAHINDDFPKELIKEHDYKTAHKSADLEDIKNEVEAYLACDDADKEKLAELVEKKEKKGI